MSGLESPDVPLGWECYVDLFLFALGWREGKLTRTASLVEGCDCSTYHPNYRDRALDWLPPADRSAAVCAGCGQPELKSELQVDHIIPRELGGCDCANNLQWLCQPCNLLKGVGTHGTLLRKLRLGEGGRPKSGRPHSYRKYLWDKIRELRERHNEQRWHQRASEMLGLIGKWEAEQLTRHNQKYDKQDYHRRAKNVYGRSAGLVVGAQP